MTGAVNLAGSLLALIIGPLLYQFGRLGPQAAAFLGGFTFITIAGLLGFSILPEAVSIGGWPAWGFLLAGLGFPVLLESRLHHYVHQAHGVILAVSISGLAVHAFVDGIALSLPAAAEPLVDAHDHGGDLGLAVLLHRFPVGLAIWFLLAPGHGVRLALLTLAGMMIATVAGFMAGESLSALLSTPGLAWFQAFVAGSILHVIVYEPGHHQSGQETLAKWPDRFGLICGLALLFVYL